MQHCATLCYKVFHLCNHFTATMQPCVTRFFICATILFWLCKLKCKDPLLSEHYIASLFENSYTCCVRLWHQYFLPLLTNKILSINIFSWATAFVIMVTLAHLYSTSTRKLLRGAPNLITQDHTIKYIHLWSLSKCRHQKGKKLMSHGSLFQSERPIKAKLARCTVKGGTNKKTSYCRVKRQARNKWHWIDR